MAAVSTEMRDTARLVNGRIVYDRRVIMARAWAKARHEFAAYQAMGLADRFPILGLFDEALRDAWADAKAVAFRLNPAPLATRDRLTLEIIGIKGADRPQASDLQRLAAAEATLATLGTDTAAPIRLDTYRAARAERLPDHGERCVAWDRLPGFELSDRDDAD